MLHHKIIGTGAPVVILHGSTLDHRHMMESCEPAFQGAGDWQRIYVDMPGHGLSPARGDIQTQDDLLAAVQEFIDALLPKRRFALIGESRGSYIAQGLVHLHPAPVTGAALIVPGGNPSADAARLPAHQVREPDPALRAELSEAELPRFDNAMVVQRRDIIDKTRRCKIPAQALWDKSQAERITQAFDFSFHSDMPAQPFHGPSVIIAGRQDHMAGYLDAIDMMAQFPCASLAVLDSAGHSAAWDRPDLFTALMRDWLMRLARAD